MSRPYTPHGFFTIDGTHTYKERPRMGEWAAQAACKGLSHLFFPEIGERARPGVEICDSCPVKIECRDHAFAAGEIYGTWGGIPERERKQMRGAARRAEDAA